MAWTIPYQEEGNRLTHCKKVRYFPVLDSTGEIAGFGKIGGTYLKVLIQHDQCPTPHYVTYHRRGNTETFTFHEPDKVVKHVEVRVKSNKMVTRVEETEPRTIKGDTEKFCSWERAERYIASRCGAEIAQLCIMYIRERL